MPPKKSIPNCKLNLFIYFFIFILKYNVNMTKQSTKVIRVQNWRFKRKLFECKKEENVLVRNPLIWLFFPTVYSSNIFEGSPTPSSLFSSTMGGLLGLQGSSCKGSTSSSPNSLYPDLVGDMQRKTEKKQTALIPLIQI